MYATGFSSDKHMCVAEIIKFTDYDEICSYHGPFDKEANTRGPILRRTVKRWKVRLQPKVYNDYRMDYEWDDEKGVKTPKKPRQVDIHRVENLVKVILPDG